MPWAPDPASHGCCRCLTPQGHAHCTEQELSSGGGRGRAGGQRLGGCRGSRRTTGRPLGQPLGSHWEATGPATPGGRSWGPGAGHGGPEQSPASWVSSRGEPSSLEPRWFPKDGGMGAGWLLPLPGRVQGAAVVSPTDPPGDHAP